MSSKLGKHVHIHFTQKLFELHAHMMCSLMHLKKILITDFFDTVIQFRPNLKITHLFPYGFLMKLSFFLMSDHQPVLFNLLREVACTAFMKILSALRIEIAEKSREISSD